MQSSLFSGVAKLALTVLICLSFLQAVTARADFINGDQLRLYCTSKNPNDEAVCFVYIAGAVDAFTTIDLMGEKASGKKTAILPSRRHIAGSVKRHNDDMAGAARG